MVSAIVLAAGMSTRMGQNKLLLSFRGKPLIVHAIDTLLASKIDEIVVVLGHEIDKVRHQIEVGLAPVRRSPAEPDEGGLVLRSFSERGSETAPQRPVRLVQNPNYQEGLSTSVRTGIKTVSPRADGIMICLADQPLLEAGDVNRIVWAFAAAKKVNKSIVVPFFEGERGNPVILDASLRDAILGIVGDVGCKGVIKRHPDKVYMLEMENDHVVRDVDDVQAYERLMG
jgi:molybdenum cofactor cytidylyltransferase